MSRNMAEWARGLMDAPDRKSLPLLSFPATRLLGLTVRRLLSDAEAQAEGMARIAEVADTAASVAFMDLSVEAECFGARVRMAEDEAPSVVGRAVTDAEGVASLTVPPVGSGRAGLCLRAVELAVGRIADRPVLAGATGPFSLAARLFGVTEILMACYDDPDMVHGLLETCASFLLAYCRAFRDIGADGVVLAEPVAGLLSPVLEAEFSAPYVRALVRGVQNDRFLVVYHNCGGNAARVAESLAGNGAAAYHFGDAARMPEMLERMPETVLVMGNISPLREFLGGTPDSVRRAALSLLRECGGRRNFVISSGCDIPPAAPWENIRAFLDAVDEYRASRRAEG